MEHYNFKTRCKHHQSSQTPPARLGFYKKKRKSKKVFESLSLCLLAISHQFPRLSLSPDNKLLITVIISASFSLDDSLAFYSLFFVSPKPLMLSVVNGLASRFKAAIAECKF